MGRFPEDKENTQNVASFTVVDCPTQIICTWILGQTPLPILVFIFPGDNLYFFACPSKLLIFLHISAPNISLHPKKSLLFCKKNCARNCLVFSTNRRFSAIF